MELSEIRKGVYSSNSRTPSVPPPPKPAPPAGWPVHAPVAPAPWRTSPAPPSSS